MQLGKAMTNPADRIAAWHAVDPTLMVKKLKKEITSGTVGTWIVNDAVAPLDLYVYLKARFGTPNGFGMTLKNTTVDNFTHWHWTLQVDDHVIEFMGFNLYAVAYVEGYPTPSADGLAKFSASIKADFSNHGPQMSQIRRTLEKWSIFLNPYKRLRDVIDEYASKLRSLDIDMLDLPSIPLTTDALESHRQRWPALQQKYTEALGLGVSLRMLAPVLAEAFINTLIFLLARPDVKSDQRIYDDVLRREIDLRVKTLHLVCMGFPGPVDTESQSFKSFLTLMNGRNDFLHGNIDPRKLQYDTVSFDGNIPLYDRYKNFSELAFVQRLIRVEPKAALNDVAIVDGFIKFLLQHLDPTSKEAVELFMSVLNPGYRVDTKQVGIVLPSSVMHGVPRSGGEGNASILH